MGEKKDDPTRVLSFTRTFDAPVESVYRVWTEVEHINQWWGPEGFSTEAKVDLREGGAWSAAMTAPSGEVHRVDGVYTEVRKNERLAFTWAWQTDGQRGHETTIEIDFVSQGDKTEMRLHQALFDSADQCGKHNEGWSSSFNCLADHLSNGAG